jgi:hypothetical protein
MLSHCKTKVSIMNIRAADYTYLGRNVGDIALNTGQNGAQGGSSKGDRNEARDRELHGSTSESSEEDFGVLLDLNQVMKFLEAYPLAFIRKGQPQGRFRTIKGSNWTT